MAGPLIVAVDQGTSATKGLLVRGDGSVAARSSVTLGQTHPQPGWVEQGANAIWASVQEAVRRCLDGQDATAVVGLGFSTQRESLVLWDRRSGEAVAPVVSWQDQRTKGACFHLRYQGHGPMVRERSGLPLDPMFSALKAKWLLDAHDPSRIKARNGYLCLGTIDSWLLSRFSGEHLIEAGNASRTQLLNVACAEWDDELLALFEVPHAALPRVVASIGPFPTSRGLAPLPDGVPVHAVMGDSHAALFAHGAFEPGRVKATYGTGSSVMGLADDPVPPASGLCSTIAWTIAGPRFAAEGNIRATGAALVWLAELFEVTPAELAELGARSESNGVALVPGFNGLGAPWWDMHATGLITGLTLGSKRGELARAALDAIVYQVADVVKAIDDHVGRVDHLHTDGGPARNAFLMQAQADCINRPVLRANDAELSGLGAAHLAGLGAGIWSLEDLRRLPRSRDEFRPSEDGADSFVKRGIWNRAVARSRGLATDDDPQMAHLRDG